MTRYYKNLALYLKFDDTTMVYEAIRYEGDYVSYLKNIITDDYKDVVIRGFSERQGEPSTEEEFNSVKEQVLLKLNS
jgi:hypothetical protein